MSTRGLIVIAAAFGALLAGLYFWRGGADYDVDELEKLAIIFDRKTASVRQGQPGYPLPDLEAGQVELAYLAELTRIMDLHTGDCEETESRLRAQRKALSPLPAPSIFRDAARELERRRGDDFVEDLSHEVHLGRTPSARLVSPSDTDERLDLLRERAGRVRLVTDGLRALEALREAGGTFADDCPRESVALQDALDYLPR